MEAKLEPPLADAVEWRISAAGAISKDQMGPCSRVILTFCVGVGSGKKCSRVCLIRVEGKPQRAGTVTL